MSPSKTSVKGSSRPPVKAASNPPVKTVSPGLAVATAAGDLVAWFKASARVLPWRTDQAAWDGLRVQEPAAALVAEAASADATSAEAASGEAAVAAPRRDPYRTWIAEIMLQQTQVSTVVAYYARWMERFPDLAALATAAEEDVLALWAGLGYYSRARNILATARELASVHGGRFPDTREGLLRLKGIGEYTAGAIASLSFNLPEPILDGNLVRVFSRLYGLAFLPADAEGKRAYWDLSRAWVEAREPALVNEGLMELGALVCTPRNPACGDCPLADRCRARAEGSQEDFPPAKPRKEPKAVRGYALVLRRGGRVLLYRPRKGELLAGLLTFPVFALAGVPSIPALKQAWGKAFPGFPAPAFRPRTATVTHGITHHQFVLSLAEAELDAGAEGWEWPEGYAWMDAARVPEALVSSFPRKIWESAGAGRGGPESPVLR